MDLLGGARDAKHTRGRRGCTPRAALAPRLGLLGLLALPGLACAPPISRSELARELEAGKPPPILDVRSRGEYEAGHVPGAVHIPFYSVVSRSDELPAAGERPLVVYCEHGPRAGLARAGLWLAGAGEVRFLEGHMSAWKEEGRPLEREEP